VPGVVASLEGKNHISKVSHFVREGGQHRVAYILSPATPRSATYNQDGTVDVPETKAFSLDHLFKTEHLADIIKKTDILPTPPKNLPENRTPVAHVLSPLASARYNSSKYWIEREVDFDAGGVYVRVKGNHWSTDNQSDRRAPELFGYEPIIHAKDIVGIRQKLYEKFDNAPQWKLLDDYIIDEYKNNHKAKNAALKRELWHKVDGNSYQDFSMLHNIIRFKPKHKDGLFAEVCNLFATMEKEAESDEATAYMIALPFLKTTLDVKSEYADAKRIYKAFEQRYPLLSEVDSWDSREKILHYVGLIDGIKLHKKKRKNKRYLQLA
jgi:hypothetical protein